MLDIDRLRDDPLYRLVWTARLAIAVLVVALAGATSYWLGWWTA